MLVSFVLLLITAIVYASAATIPAATGLLEVYALPVGQGDCTIIQCPSDKLVVNDCGSSGGPRWTADEVKRYLGARVKDIVAIVISHGDRDHYNYLPEITDYTSTNIQSVIIGGTVTDYGPIQTWLNNFHTKLRLVSNGGSCIGDCAVTGGTNFCGNANIKFNILAANVVQRTTNQKSIVLKLVDTLFSMLLPGDIEGSAASKIAKKIGSDLQSHIYKMAHHGSGTQANLPKWLNHIKPEIAFASSGYNFGICRHPRCITIERLNDLMTISNATAHAFYCGNYRGGPTDDPKFTKSMYETNPTANTICLLKFAAPNTFSQSCSTVVAMEYSQLVTKHHQIDGESSCFPGPPLPPCEY